MAIDANKRRVVVTGMGVITPICNSVQEYWQALRTEKAVQVQLPFSMPAYMKQDLPVK